MPSYSHHAAIEAPREVVWRVLSNVAAWPRWLPTVSNVDKLDGDALRPGARFVVHQPKLRPATWTVVEVTEPESFTWEARVPGLQMIAEHRVERLSATQSAVDLTFTFTGLLGGVMGWAYGTITESYLAQEAAALKKATEGARS